ncbi:MAG: flagellar basal body P-ring formation protein FlgA [Sedimentisphaerales bacterium]|nr:flagellar basal body P-ring formation protein FlgA [Sedimentisphaerales bacterium]
MQIQKHKSAKIVLIGVAMVFAFFYHASAKNVTDDSQENTGLSIYLPREVMVKDADLTLGQVSVIQGSGPLVAKANNIAIGRISVANQSVVIDRTTVLSRLASSGIPSSNVTFKGADETTVQRQQRAVSSQELVVLASSFIENHPPDASIRQWNVIRKPKDLVIPEEDGTLQFTPRLILSRTKSQARVEIAVSCGGHQIGIRNVDFALKYNCRQAVTITPIAKDTVISPENVKIEVEQSNYPEPSDWKPPFGLIAKRPLAANTILQPYMVESYSSPTIVKRNQSVVIRIEMPGLLITATGMTLEDGKTGEHIRVRNADSQRIILARICEDGSVEPVI